MLLEEFVFGSATSKAWPVSEIGFDEFSFQVTGSGTMTIVAEGTLDGSNWVGIQMRQGSTAISGASAAGIYNFSGAYMSQVRLRVSSYSSGTLTVKMSKTNGTAFWQAATSNGSSLLQIFTESEIVPYQNLSTPSGDYDFGTVPAGEKWMLIGVSHYNPTGGTLVYTPQFKRGGTYYTTHTGQSVATTVSGSLSTIWLPILEEGEALSVNTNGAGLRLEFVVLKFKSTATIQSYTILNLANGDNKLFECPAGYSALAFSMTNTGGFLNINASASLIALLNKSGGARTVYACRVASGGSPAAPGAGSNALGASSLVSNTSTWTMPGSATLGFTPGDSLWINTNSGASGQICSIKIILFPIV